MTRSGDASWTFWKNYVQPHWKIWLGTGALAAYLAAPDTFQDAAGRLTESGFQRLTELGGTAAAAAIRGIGKGSGKAAETVKHALAITGTVLLGLVLILMIRRFRHFIMEPFRWLHGIPARKIAPPSGLDEGAEKWSGVSHGEKT